MAVNKTLARVALLITLGLDSETWLNLANDLGKGYHGTVGSLEELALFVAHTGKQWISGKNKLRRIYHYFFYYLYFTYQLIADS